MVHFVNAADLITLKTVYAVMMMIIRMMSYDEGVISRAYLYV